MPWAIQGFAFAPATLDVPAGMEVTWTNQDPAPHTVTADDGSFDSGTIDPGATFSAVFDQSGTVTYLCNIHPANDRDRPSGLRKACRSSWSPFVVMMVDGSERRP